MAQRKLWTLEAGRRDERGGLERGTRSVEDMGKGDYTACGEGAGSHLPEGMLG